MKKPFEECEVEEEKEKVEQQERHENDALAVTFTTQQINSKKL
jgi:hypothetical protein